MSRSYNSPSEEVSHGKKKFFRVLLIVLVILVPIGTGTALVVHNFSSLRQEYSKFRSKDFIKKAKAALAENNTTTARIFLQNAARHTPDTEDVWDVFTELLIKENSEDALLALAERYRKFPNLQHAREFLQGAINKNGFAVVLPFIQNFLDTFPDNVEILRLIALLFISMRELGEAEYHLQSALKIDPNNPGLMLDLATIHLAHPDPEKSNKARQTLELLRKNPDFFLVATRSLAAHTSLTDLQSALALYEEILDKHPEDWVSRIRAFQIRCRLNANEAYNMLDSVMAKATETPQKVELLSTVLTTFGPSVLLEFSNKLPPEVRMEPSIAFIRITALWQQGRFEDILRMANEGFANTKDLYDKAVFLNWLHRVHRELDQVALVNRSYDDMRKLALQDPRVASYYYNFFILEGNETSALPFLEILALDADSHEGKIALAQLFYYYRNRGDTAGLLSIHERLLAVQPESPFIQNNLATLLVLTGGDINRALRLSENAYLLEPDNSIYASNYAHTLAVVGRSAEALRVYAKIPQEKIDDNIRLYYAHTLYLDGQFDKALQMVKGLSQDGLLPEEKAYLEKITATTQPAGLSPEPLTATSLE